MVTPPIPQLADVFFDYYLCLVFGNTAFRLIIGSLFLKITFICNKALYCIEDKYFNIQSKHSNKIINKYNALGTIHEAGCVYLKECLR